MQEETTVLEPESGNLEPIVPEIKFYTTEELEALHPTVIDLERVDPAVRPIVDKTIKEYKGLQAEFTRKSQELAEIKKPAVQETYFEDSSMNKAFADFLVDPIKAVRDINAEIRKLEGVVPDDGIDEYRKARQAIAYYVDIKDQFQIKQGQVERAKQQASIEDAKLNAELGADASTLLDYAKTMGFSEREFKSRPELRQAIKGMYVKENATTIAARKEVKPKPHQASTPSGDAGGTSSDADNDPSFDPKMSTEARIALWRQQKK